MNPVGIFRHSSTEGPGYFATYLTRQGIPWCLIKVDQGEAVPSNAREFSGLCFMGGPMSVNDDLPWIALVLRLIRDAVRDEVPVIGHCLGGQLIAKALGAVVMRNPVKEIGWGPVNVVPNVESERWLGTTNVFDSFHWHGETFSLPSGATRIAGSPYCANQMFVLGKHLAMQCHVEMTPELIATWCKDWDKEVRSLAERAPSVQTPDEMLANVDARVARLHGVADGLYGEWIKGLAR